MEVEHLAEGRWQLQLLCLKMGLYFWMLSVISIMSLVAISLIEFSWTTSFVLLQKQLRKSGLKEMNRRLLLFSRL